MSQRGDLSERPALDQVEESVALLRSCPVFILALYYIGTLPFVLTFLFFFAEMSRGAFARNHLVEGSLYTTLAFFWCKTGQAVFASHLLAHAGRRKLPRWTLGRLFRVALGQTALQWSGLIVLPIAALITLPFGYAFAFYQNCTALALDGAGETLDRREIRREAMTHAKRWVRQNHYGLLVLVAFALVVAVNVMALIFITPFLLKTFLGIETVFSRSMMSMFNTTLWTAVGGLTYLAIDPLIKAFYVLRCFHARSLSTGEDLRVELRNTIASGHGSELPAEQAAPLPAKPRRPSLALVCLLLMALLPAPAPAGLVASPVSRPPAATAEQPREIDRSLSEVLGRPEFAWRDKRQAPSEEEEEGWLGSMVHGTGKLVRKWLRPVGRLWGKATRWLGKLWASKQQVREEDFDRQSGSFDFGAMLKPFVWIFCGVALLAALVLGWRAWRRRTPQVVISAEPLQPAPDLTSENIAADELPEDGWLTLAREMLAKGEPRLAIRALYLAALANLGERNFISIARYKSNYEYQRELRRRRPGQPELQATFSSTVNSFERAWYGMHEVTPEILTASEENLQRIRQS